MSNPANRRVEMSDFQVLIQEYEDLSDHEKEWVSDKGLYGAECANYLRVMHCGETLLLESDAMDMDPEQVTFRRDLSWIETALGNAYKAGLKDANQWKSMEIAPTNRKIMVCRKSDDGEYSYWWGLFEDNEWWVQYGNHWACVSDIVCWKDLPEPPISQC